MQYFIYFSRQAVHKSKSIVENPNTPPRSRSKSTSAFDGYKILKDDSTMPNSQTRKNKLTAGAVRFPSVGQCFSYLNIIVHLRLILSYHYI